MNLRDASGAVEGVETSRGLIRSKRIGVSAAGNTSVVLGLAGVKLPLESFPLQALVSEPIKPAMLKPPVVEAPAAEIIPMPAREAPVQLQEAA